MPYSVEWGAAVGTNSSFSDTVQPTQSTGQHDQRAESRSEQRPDRRGREAIAVFAAAWDGCPDRVLLVDADRWAVIAANPAARNEVLAAHGIDLIGMPVGQLSPGHDDPDEVRANWRGEPGIEDTVRPHSFEPDRFIRAQTWAMGGFEGRFLISVVRDVDLGLARRDPIDKARPLLDVSTNLVAVVSRGEFRYRNRRFVDQFGSTRSLDALIAQCIHPDDRLLCRESVDAAESGEPGRPIPVSVSNSARVGGDSEAAGHHWVRAEWVVAPAPGFDAGGLLLVIGALDPVAQVDWAFDGFDDRYIVVAGRDTEVAPYSPTVMPTTLPASLARREREIVEMILLGLRVPSIAKSLYLSEHTIRNHLRSVFAKCQVHSQRELVEKLRS